MKKTIVITGASSGLGKTLAADLAKQGHTVHALARSAEKLDELKAIHPTHIKEALAMARIMAKVLPENDIEKTLCSRIVSHLAPLPSRLEFEKRR